MFNDLKNVMLLLLHVMMNVLAAERENQKKAQPSSSLLSVIHPFHSHHIA